MGGAPAGQASTQAAPFWAEYGQAACPWCKTDTMRLDGGCIRCTLCDMSAIPGTWLRHILGRDRRDTDTILARYGLLAGPEATPAEGDRACLRAVLLGLLGEEGTAWVPLYRVKRGMPAHLSINGVVVLMKRCGIIRGKHERKQVDVLSLSSVNRADVADAPSQYFASYLIHRSRVLAL